MTFADELKMALAVEKEGQQKLQRAHAEAEAMIAQARAEVRRLFAEGERALDQERSERTAHLDREIEIEIARRRHLVAERMERLQALAEKNRDRVVEGIVSWLWAG